MSVFTSTILCFTILCHFRRYENEIGVASRADKKYVKLWKKAYEFHLPEIRNTIKSHGGGIAGIRGSGIFTLVEL